MITREDILSYNEEALFADGFDEAIIGVAQRPNLGPVVAYSVEKILEILWKIYLLICRNKMLKISFRPKRIYLKAI